MVRIAPTFQPYKHPRPQAIRFRGEEQEPLDDPKFWETKKTFPKFTLALLPRSVLAFSMIYGVALIQGILGLPASAAAVALAILLPILPELKEVSASFPINKKIREKMRKEYERQAAETIEDFKQRKNR